MMLTVLSYLLETFGAGCDWQSGVLRLLSTRAETDLTHMGFTPGWENCPFWNGRIVEGESDSAQ